MNQQIKQLQQAKKQLGKSREDAEQAMVTIRRSQGDLGLFKEVRRAIDTLTRACQRIDQQCCRIERRVSRTKPMTTNDDNYEVAA